MSLKKQIKRNMEKQTKATIKQYEPLLKPGWQDLPMSDLNLFANMARNGITLDDLNREIKKARQQAYEDTSIAIMKVLYACIAITLMDEYKFSKDDCLEALSKIDHKMAYTIDSEEIVKEMEEKVGIRFNSGNGIERIEML